MLKRSLRHYNLPAILAVGYRVRSHRGIQFRQWTTESLSEYMVKGFTIDDERLKNPPGKGQTEYFDDLLNRIRDIRSSERRFYQKVLDIYATSVSYPVNAKDSLTTAVSESLKAGEGDRTLDINLGKDRTTVLSTSAQRLTSSQDPVCTSVCTAEQKFDKTDDPDTRIDDPIAQIVRGIAKLTKSDRKRLLAILYPH